MLGEIILGKYYLSVECKGNKINHLRKLYLTKHTSFNRFNGIQRYYFNLSALTSRPKMRFFRLTATVGRPVTSTSRERSIPWPLQFISSLFAFYVIQYLFVLKIMSILGCDWVT